MNQEELEKERREMGLLILFAGIGVLIVSLGEFPSFLNKIMVILIGGIVSCVGIRIAMVK